MDGVSYQRGFSGIDFCAGYSNEVTLTVLRAERTCTGRWQHCNRLSSDAGMMVYSCENEFCTVRIWNLMGNFEDGL